MIEDEHRAPRVALLQRPGWGGVWVGLAPFGYIVGIAFVALGLAAVARQAMASSGFFAQQEAALFVLVPGMLLVIIAYFVSGARVLRQAARWRAAGQIRNAVVALWTLGITAVLVLVPFVLAVALPQQPAP